MNKVYWVPSLYVYVPEQLEVFYSCLVFKSLSTIGWCLQKGVPKHEVVIFSKMAINNFDYISVIYIDHLTL
jgi:hypothetical protein